MNQFHKFNKCMQYADIEPSKSHPQQINAHICVSKYNENSFDMLFGNNFLLLCFDLLPVIVGIFFFVRLLLLCCSVDCIGLSTFIN